MNIILKTHKKLEKLVFFNKKKHNFVLRFSQKIFNFLLYFLKYFVMICILFFRRFKTNSKYKINVKRLYTF